MKVLLLGPYNRSIIDTVRSSGDIPIVMENTIIDRQHKKTADYIISFGYRHIIPREVVDLYEYQAINLHISYLPWNKGADPNLWSFLENTPKGISIHYIDHGIDTGPVLTQQMIDIDDSATLRSSYYCLHEALENLFRERWIEIRDGTIDASRQTEIGTCHKSTDKNDYQHLLTNGWDTPISLIAGQALP
ncbi:MAG: formyl transferase [Acidiferrobacteraceae bacterium]|nr:formyl transferase [Acidiferrobacteraceae bacterium]